MKLQAAPRWDLIRLRWQLNVQSDGRRRSFVSSKPGRPGSTECKRKAELWLDNQLDKGSWRLDRAYTAYIAACTGLVDDSTKKQRDAYGRLYVVPALGKKKMQSVTDQDWQDCITKAGNVVSERTKRKPSKKTLLNLRATIVNFCKYAKRSRMIDHVPEELAIPKSAEYLPYRIIQPDDLAKLFEPCDDWYINLFRFMAVTGLRPGEAMGLKESDIVNGVLTIKRSVTVMKTISKGKNRNARRDIKLHALANSLLADQKKHLLAAGVISPWVFPNRYGEPPVQSGVSSAWDRFRAHNGIDCTMYGLRHTFYSLTRSELPLSLSKRIMGHSESMDTDKQYGHDVDGELDQAAEILDGVFARYTQKVHS